MELRLYRCNKNVNVHVMILEGHIIILQLIVIFAIHFFIFRLDSERIIYVFIALKLSYFFQKLKKDNATFIVQ